MSLVTLHRYIIIYSVRCCGEAKVLKLLLNLVQLGMSRETQSTEHELHGGFLRLTWET